AGLVDQIPLAPQSGGDRVGDRLLVLNDEDAGCGHSSTIRSSRGGVRMGLWRNRADRASNFLIVARDAPDAELLARALAPACGPGTIDRLRRLSGGASRETWSFDLVAPDGARHALVLRRDPAATALQSARSTGYGLIAEAAGAGVAVPKVRVLLEPDDALGDGFVMDRIAGETIPRKILRDDAYASARPLLAAQSGRAAAAIHAIDTASLPALEVQ